MCGHGGTSGGKHGVNHKDLPLRAVGRTMLICYEATRDLQLEDVRIETPICSAIVREDRAQYIRVHSVSHPALQYTCPHPGVPAS